MDIYDCKYIYFSGVLIILLSLNEKVVIKSRLLLYLKIRNAQKNILDTWSLKFYWRIEYSNIIKDNNTNSMGFVYMKPRDITNNWLKLVYLQINSINVKIVKPFVKQSSWVQLIFKIDEKYICDSYYSLRNLSKLWS